MLHKKKINIQSLLYSMCLVRIQVCACGNLRNPFCLQPFPGIFHGSRKYFQSEWLRGQVLAKELPYVTNVRPESCSPSKGSMDFSGALTGNPQVSKHENTMGSSKSLFPLPHWVHIFWKHLKPGNVHIPSAQVELGKVHEAWSIVLPFQGGWACCTSSCWTPQAAVFFDSSDRKMGTFADSKTDQHQNRRGNLTHKWKPWIEHIIKSLLMPSCFQS